ncbi:MAG: YybH family protein [Pyrinomonadaceae bacterium]
MKALVALLTALFFVNCCFGQGSAQKIYDTEREFEKAVAEKGINAGFIEYLTPDGIIFNPDAQNGRESWSKRPKSPASLTWNPIWIEVSSNGALAYSVGNGIYKPKGKDDTTQYFSHYLSIWSRQPSGEYRAVLDAGINHGKPASMPTEWKSPEAKGNSKLLNSAGDHSVPFFTMVETQGAVKAYKMFLAEDAFLLREGNVPLVGKAAAVGFLESANPKIKFSKRKTFIEAGDLAWVNNLYSITGDAGKEIERGNFIQVWKLRDGKWRIAADMFLPIPQQGQ